jgi:hypothetical protein
MSSSRPIRGTWHELLQVTAVFLDTGKQSVQTGEITKLLLCIPQQCYSISFASEFYCVIPSYRKALVPLFDKVSSGALKEGEMLSQKIIDIHRKRY